MGEDEDELDAYMNANDSKLKQEKLNKISSRLIQIKQEIDSTSKLLAIVKPINMQSA
jgi:hypothetical protein